MQIQRLCWKDLPDVERRAVPQPIKELFDNAKEANSVFVYYAALKFGEAIVEEGKFATDDIEKTNEDCRQFIEDIKAGRIHPIGVPLNKTFEVSSHEGLDGTGRVLPTTLLYPGDPFGLWEAMQDFDGKWTIHAGCRSFLILQSMGDQRVLDRMNVSNDSSSLKWTGNSHLRFDLLIDPDECAWEAHVLLFPNDIFKESELKHLQLQNQLLKLTGSQMKRALESSRDQRFRIGSRRTEVNDFYQDIVHAFKSIRDGSTYGYYLCPNIASPDVMEDLPIEQLLKRCDEYFLAKNKNGYEPGTLPIFVPCLLNKHTRERTSSKVYQLPDICPIFKQIDFADHLELFLRQQFPARRVATIKDLVPALRRIPIANSVLAHQITPPLTFPHLTEAQFPDTSGADNHAVLRFFVDPGDQKKNSPLKNRCRPDWIPLTYENTAPQREIKISSLPSTVVWCVQIDVSAQ